MNKREYFALLKKKLPKDPYKERFLEELEEHFEDALYAEQVKRTTPEALVLEKMGSPEQTVLYYQKFMSKKSPLYPYLESLFWGLLATPLYIIVFMASGLTEETEVLTAKLTIYFLSTVILSALFYGFYRFVFSNLKPLNQLLSQKGKLLSFTINILPALGSSSLFVLTFYLEADERQDYLFPIVIGGYLCAITFSAWKAYRHSFERKIWVVASPVLRYLLSLLIISLLVATEFIAALFYFTKVAWTIFFIGNLKLAIISSGLLLFALGFFCLISIWRWHRERKTAFPFLKTGFLFLAIYALFIPISVTSDPYPMELTWSRPQVELAQTLEKKAMWPFYQWSEKYRYDDGPNLYFDISSREQGFLIHLEGIADYYFNPSSLETLNIEARSIGIQELEYGQIQVLPEGVRCEPFPGMIDDFVEGQALVLGGETDCKALYYNDELVFSRSGKYWLVLTDAVLSSDKKWLLLKFQNTIDSPTLIHLVSLED